MVDDSKTFKPVNPLERGELAEGAELVDSPLRPGGHQTAEPEALSAQFPGLVDFPTQRRDPRIGANRIRRKGWVDRRSQARRHFRDISGKSGATSESRVLAGLRSRGGLLALARRKATHQRFTHERRLRG